MADPTADPSANPTANPTADPTARTQPEAAQPEATESLEVEVKLAADADLVVPDLTAIEGVDSLLDTAEHHLTAIYVDTADLRLTRAKMTLRRRTGGADDGWHLKLPAAAGRREIHAPLGEESSEGLGQRVPETLLSHVRAIVRTAPLEPIAQINNRRVVVDLGSATGEKVAEFCDDHVTAWSLLPGGERTSWREWEVELSEFTTGTEAGARLIARATAHLVAAGARVSESPSKLTTALGASRDAAPLPPYLRVPEIAEGSAAAAVVAAVRTQRDAIVGWEPRVRANEWDSVHQLRVATREMRSLLETFEGILTGEQLHHLEAELKYVAAVLGVARDAEVVEQRFCTLLDTDSSGLIDATAATHIRNDMRADYARAHAQIVEMLDSDRFLELLDTIDQLLAYPPVAATGDNESGDEPGDERPAHTPREVLLAHLERAHEKLVKRHTKVLAHYEDPDRSLHERENYVHDVRKAAKKLRYASVAAEGAGLKTKRLTKACKQLQTILGDFQDAVTSRDRIQRLAASARERGEDTFAYGLVYQREMDRGARCLDGYAEAVAAVEKAFTKVR